MGDLRPMHRCYLGFYGASKTWVGSQNGIAWPTSLATDSAFAIGISAGAAANAGSTPGSSICGLEVVVPVKWWPTSASLAESTSEPFHQPNLLLLNPLLFHRFMYGEEGVLWRVVCKRCLRRYHSPSLLAFDASNIESLKPCLQKPQSGLSGKEGAKDGTILQGTAKKSMFLECLSWIFACLMGSNLDSSYIDVNSLSFVPELSLYCIRATLLHFY